MRIVEGIWGGTDLVSPARGVRPTAEDVRSRWMEYLGERLNRAVVLDLFAGTGALGLEALSRGAAHADFVENGARSLHALKANVAKLRLRTPPRGWRAASGDPPPGRFATARIFKRDAIPFVEALEPHSYDLAFVDAPYGSAKLDRVLATWRERPFARILGAEHAADQEVPGGGRTLQFGDTVVTVYGIPRRGRSRGKKRAG